MLISSAQRHTCIVPGFFQFKLLRTLSHLLNKIIFLSFRDSMHALLQSASDTKIPAS